MNLLRSLRFRIAAAFAAALGALLATTVFFAWHQRNVSHSLEFVTQGLLPLATVASRLDRDHQRVQNDVERVLAEAKRPGSGRTAPIAIYTEELQRNLSDGREAVRAATPLAPGAEGQAILNKVTVHLDRIEADARTWQDRANRMNELAAAGHLDEARALADPFAKDGEEVGDEIDQLVRLVSGRISSQTSAIEEEQVRATAIAAALAIGAFGFSFALIAAVFLALRRIGVLTAEVQRLGKGDYGGQMEVRGGDEIAVLAAEFNTMVRAIALRDRTIHERAQDLHRLSHYLASVLDSLQDALVVVEDERVTLANPAAERVWGARVGSAPPASLAMTGESGTRQEQKGPQGTLHEVRVSRLGSEGRVVIAADVTEQTRTREQLARSQQLALVGQMLAQITHEVRNPLNALSLNAELLGDELGELDPARRTQAWDQLGTISSEIDRLTEVTAHYLQMARRPRAQPQPEDLNALVNEVTRLLEAEHQQAGVALRLALDPALPLLWLDGNQIRQALLNILRNAVEAGAKTLSLEVRREATEVALSLTDDGPGMTPEEVERACDPFFSTKVSGTGLGLAITKQIVDDHHGLLRVTSVRGSGTTVTFALPLRPALPAAADEEQPDAPDLAGR